jgi:hypothetical protein
MFFEIVKCVQILITFDQNPANHVKEITQAALVRNVQNSADKFYSFENELCLLAKKIE